MKLYKFIKNIYNNVFQKHYAEYKKIKEEELANHQIELKEIRDKFFDIVKNGTKKYDVLSIKYKWSKFSSRWWNDFKEGYEWKLIVLCDDNTLENAKNAYDTSASKTKDGRGNDAYWAYLNATNDKEKRETGFKIIFKPGFKDGKLLATSFKTTISDKADLIYLFDVDDIKLNDKNDIDEIIDLLTNKPRDFYCSLDNIIKELELKK